MPKTIIFLLLAFGSLAIEAQAQILADVGAGVRYEHSDSDSSYRGLYPLFFQAGFGRGQTSLLGEYLFFQDKHDVDSGISVRQSHQSVMLWLRHSLYSPSIYGLFVGGGLGSFRDRADTEFLGTDASNVGNWEPEFGLQAGWWQQIVHPIFVEIDGSARFGSGYNPDPIWTVSASFGLEF